jgi:autotransporter-associated beta strand protein
VQSSKAATFYWDSDSIGINNVLTGGGLGGLGTWNTTGSNWWNGGSLSGISAWNNLGNDTAVFTGTAGQIALGTGVTVGGLQFNTTGYTLGAAANTNAITFGTNSNIVLNNVPAATINGSLLGSGNVNLTGGVFGGFTAGTLNLQGTGTGLTGYAGSTTINNGMTMALSQNSQALVSTSGITLNGGGILLTNTTNAEAALIRVNATTAIASNNGTFTVTNAAAETTALTSLGVLTANSGRTQLVSSTALTAGAQTLTLGTGSLAPTGTGTLAVGMGGYTAGTISALNSIVITGAATTTNTIIGPWATVGTAGTVQTDYATYGYSGGTMNAATGANTGGAATAAGITGANVTAVTAFPTASAYSTTANMTLSAVANLTANTNLNTLRYSGAAGTVAGAFTLGTFGVLQAGSGTLTINPTAVTLPTAAPGSIFLTTGNTFGITVSAPINNNGANAATVVLSGQNIVILSSTTSNYTGGTIVNSGTLSIGANTNLGAAAGGLTFNGSGGLTFTAGATVGTSGTAGNRPLALNNGALATVTTGAFNSSLIGNISGTGGIILAGTSGNSLTIGQTGSTSTYTGPTIINLGTLKAGVANAFGNNSAVTLANVAGTVLDITGFNTAIGSLSGGGTIGGNVTLGAATLTLGGNNENTSYAGVISGTGTITKTGSGTTTLTATNTFTGSPNLNGGLINITNISNLGSGTAISFAGGGGVQFATNATSVTNDLSTRTLSIGAGGATFDTNNNQIIFANAIGNGGAGGLTKMGNGTLFLQAANNFLGATNVAGGVLNISNSGALGTSTAITTVSSGAALALQGSISVPPTTSLSLSGNGALSGQNGALVNVSGSNTFGGAISLAAASSISSDSGSLSLTNSISGSGDLTLGGAGAGSVAGNLTHTGGLNKAGAGTWTLSGTGGTFAGPTSISGGTLNIVGGALGTTSGTTLGAAALNLTSGSQPIGNLTLTAGTRSVVNLGSAATLTVGSTITRGTGSSVLFDISAGGGAVIPTSATGSGTNNILGYATVNDGTVGMAQISGGNIIRFDSAALATTLADNSNTATTDYTTLGMASNPLAWSNGITTRSVNSLTFDTSGGAQTVHMGAVGNALTLTSGAIQFIGANNGTLLGGQVGASNAELIVQQNGTGIFGINSPISSGTGSLTKLGTGTLNLAPISTQTGTTAASTTISGLSDTSKLAVGQLVTGGGIPAGATVASIVNGTTIIISTAATTSASTALTFGSANSYSGATIVNVGSIQGGSAGAFSGNSAYTLANVAGVSLDLNGFNQSVKALAGGGTTGGNVLLGGGATLNVGGSNTISNIANSNIHTTFGGLISGTGNLTIAGGGSLTLTNNANSYSGQTNINAGTLVISNPGQLGTGTSPIVINGVASLSGLPGGALVVQGGTAGITFNRDITAQHRQQHLHRQCFLRWYQ